MIRTFVPSNVSARALKGRLLKQIGQPGGHRAEPNPSRGHFS